MAGSVFMRCTCWRFLPLVLMLMATAPALAMETKAPQRIVSINMCTDGLLLALADPAQITSLSSLSHNKDNVTWADAAAAFPSNRGRAEEILALSPDLVLTSRFTTPATLLMLRRLGMPVIELDVPHNFDEIRSQIRKIGKIIHQQDKAETVIEIMNSRLSRQTAPPIRALVLQANGIVVGKNTLADDIVSEAGFINIASVEGISGYGRMSLEAIIKHNPDILIIDADNANGHARASQILQHPALHALIARGTRIVTIPSKLWACAGPWSVEMVAFLRHKAQLQQ